MKFTTKERISHLLQKYEYLHQHMQGCPNDKQTFIDEYQNTVFI